MWPFYLDSSAAAEISISGRRPAGSLVVWTMEFCNGRQAVMSALEALVLAGLNAFSVLFILRILGKLGGACAR
jgi:hypothetical protein